MTRLKIFKGEKDISDEISPTERKSNPFGWSQSKIMHGEEFVGWIESGTPMNFQDGYSFTLTEE